MDLPPSIRRSLALLAAVALVSLAGGSGCQHRAAGAAQASAEVLQESATPTGGEERLELGPPPVVGAIGTPHPIVVWGLDPAGRWLVACQDRTGEAVLFGLHGMLYDRDLRPYLFEGAGAGVEIDAFLGRSADGGTFATIEGGRLTLRRVGGEPRTLDTGDLGWDRTDFHGGLLVGFLEGDAPAVAFLRGKDPDLRRVIVHRLDDQREVTLDHGPGRLFSASTDGPWIRLLIDVSRPGDRRPRKETNRYHGPCGSGWPMGVLDPGTRPLERRFVRADGGPPRTVDDLIGILGDLAITRRNDDSIWGVPLIGEARATELFEAACAARIAGASERFEAIVVTCIADEADGFAPLRHWRAGGVRDLGINAAVDPRERVRWARGEWPMIHVRHSDGDALVDLRGGGVVPLASERQRVDDVFGYEHIVLSRRGGALSWLDLETRRESPLAGGVVNAGGRTRRAGPFVYVEPLVVDLRGREPKVLGVVDPPSVFGLAPSGHVLVSDEPRPDERAVNGPLHWRAPTPLPK